jgi:hypothetical protein
MIQHQVLLQLKHYMHHLVGLYIYIKHIYANTYMYFIHHIALILRLKNKLEKNSFKVINLPRTTILRFKIIRRDLSQWLTMQFRDNT